MLGEAVEAIVADRVESSELIDLRTRSQLFNYSILNEVGSRNMHTDAHKEKIFSGSQANKQTYTRNKWLTYVFGLFCQHPLEVRCGFSQGLTQCHRHRAEGERLAFRSLQQLLLLSHLQRI